jgi:hypothetical protein
MFLATVVYAINPKSPQTPVEGFVSFTKTDDKAIRRRSQLEKDILTDNYKSWPGERRRAKIRQFKEKGWEIVVKNVQVM